MSRKIDSNAADAIDQRVIDWYHENGFVVGPVFLKRLYEETPGEDTSKGLGPKLKKEIFFKSKWQDFDLTASEAYFKEHSAKAISLLVGDSSVCPFVVIDVDNQQDFRDFLDQAGIEFADLESAPRVRSGPNSIHLYFAFDPRLTKKVVKLKYEGSQFDVDPITTGANIIAPPSTFVYGKFSKTYRWENVPLDDHGVPEIRFDDLPKLPEALIEVWLDNITPNVPIDDDDLADELSKMSVDDQHSKKKAIVELLNALPQETSDDYMSWIKVGLTLKGLSGNGDDYLDVWTDFSKKSKKFKPGECKRLWLTMTPKSTAPGHKVLLNMLKEHDPELSNNLKKAFSGDTNADGDYVVETTDVVMSALYPPQGGHSMDVIRKWIKNCIAFIADGGYYVLKEISHDGHIKFRCVANSALNMHFDYKIFQIVDGKKKKIMLSEIIRDNRRLVHYERLEFRPSCPLWPIKTSPKAFNGFDSLKVMYDPSYEIKMEVIQPILDHIKYVFCKGDPEVYDYLMGWLAHILQFPYKKTVVCFVLLSQEEGIGKNLIFDDFFCKRVIGPHYSCIIEDVSRLFAQFNDHLENKIFTVLNEAGTYGGAYKQADRMKSKISDTSILIEGKNMPTRQVPDYNNYCVLTNNDWVVNVGKTSRRYFCVESGNSYGPTYIVNNKTYFQPLVDLVLDNPDCPKSFYHYLVRKDISSWDHTNIPGTAYKTKLKLKSAEQYVRFLHDLIGDDREDIFGSNILGHVPFAKSNEEKVSKSHVYRLYQMWRGENPWHETTKEYSQYQLSRHLNKLGFPETKVGHDDRARLLSKAEIERVLSKY